MAITDPLAINFVQTTLAPICEDIRALKAKIDDAGIAWFNGVNSVIPNTSETLDAGNLRTGLLPLSGSQITNAITQILALQTLLNESGVMSTISRPTSHPLGAQ